MPTKPVSWLLHLTNLHYGLNRQDCLWPNLRKPVLDGLAKLRKYAGPLYAALFTGELVQQDFSRIQTKNTYVI